MWIMHLPRSPVIPVLLQVCLVMASTSGVHKQSYDTSSSKTSSDHGSSASWSNLSHDALLNNDATWIR